VKSATLSLEALSSAEQSLRLTKVAEEIREYLGAKESASAESELCWWLFLLSRLEIIVSIGEEVKLMIASGIETNY
jgi:hypothetical protein